MSPRIHVLRTVALIGALACQPEVTEPVDTDIIEEPDTDVEEPDTDVEEPDTDEPTCEEELGDLDSDGDGLTDCRELELGTALHLADTDGDGFSDFREVVELGFSPDNNNFKFNPRIADTPRINIAITSPPAIALKYETNTGVERTHEVERSESSSNTLTTAQSSTNSHAVEWTESVGGSVTVSGSASFPFGFSASTEASVSYDSSKSTTQETSFTWSEEQSLENSVGLSEAEGLARTEGTSVTGGRMAITVDVENAGDIAYTLSNMSISAYMSTPGEEQILSPIGSLDIEREDFPEFTYGPGQVNGPFVFVNDNVGTGTATSLLADSTNLHVEVVAYELTDADGRSFTHNQTDVAARTATIIVDYDGEDTLLDSERYQVSTNVDAEKLRITAWDAMTEILRLPYEMDETDANRELIAVRDVANDAERNGYWVTLRRSTDGLTDTVDFMGPGRGEYDFGSLELKSGDVLHLVYILDEDRDGLGRRQELAYGTDEHKADTDGDGLHDGDEINLFHTDPLSADTDNDCMDDALEIELGTDPDVADAGACLPDTNTLYFQGREFTFSDIDINGSGPFYIAEPGEELEFTSAWSLEVPRVTYCPTCVIQLYVGMRDHWSQCLASHTMNVGRTNAGDVSQVFTAPEEPGEYRITQDHSLQFRCNPDRNVTDNPERALGMVVVR